ncbi:unnamed protein product [Dimorphilus gyrociliatus]|uniref:Uncharacterized protein n=1 Tax=Dimorphilus gyrociliatus TaxID=2664684 RepID=A0A7I8VW81_9ANNE|nr:unnamed protein product [Dimorphilus gyrociliatus]
MDCFRREKQLNARIKAQHLRTKSFHEHEDLRLQNTYKRLETFWEKTQSRIKKEKQLLVEELLTNEELKEADEALKQKELKESPRNSPSYDCQFAYPSRNKITCNIWPCRVSESYNSIGKNELLITLAKWMECLYSLLFFLGFDIDQTKPALDRFRTSLKMATSSVNTEKLISDLEARSIRRRQNSSKNKILHKQQGLAQLLVQLRKNSEKVRPDDWVVNYGMSSPKRKLTTVVLPR